jgi:hypothetical protein
MSYLNAYGKKRRFQEGGCGCGSVQAGPEQGGGQEEEILALAQATGGDQAAAQLGAMLAPMILQEVQAGGGGGEEEMAPQEAQPVFRKGGKFVGTIASNFLKYTLKLVPLLV